MGRRQEPQSGNYICRANIKHDQLYMDSMLLVVAGVSALLLLFLALLFLWLDALLVARDIW